MSTLYVDNLQPNLSNGVKIPGHVIQVAQATANGEVTTNSTSFVNTGLISLSFPNAITSGSKVLVHVEGTISEEGSGSWALPTVITVYEDSTNIGNDNLNGFCGSHTGYEGNSSLNGYMMERVYGSVLYTPSSLNPTYTLWMKSHSTGFNRTIGSSYFSDSRYNVGGTRITIQEIAQ